MKKRYSIVLLFVFQSYFAQDSRLYDNEWYLTKLVENGTDVFPPTNNEVPYVPLSFNQEFSSMTSDVCNYMSGATVFNDSGNGFLFTNYIFSLMMCNSPNNQSFEGQYFYFFSQNFPDDVFTYTITESGDVKTLILNSASNKQAIYSNVLLAAKKFNASGFSITPNPATNFINLKFNSDFEQADVEIYDTLGKLCQKGNVSSSAHQINIEALTSGVYLVIVRSGNETFTQKLVKM